MSSCPKPYLIFGAGGLVPDVIEMLERSHGAEIAGLVVDLRTDKREAHGHRIFHWDEVKGRPDAFVAVNSIGRPRRRGFIEMAEAHGFRFEGLVDPSAVVFPSAQVSDTAVIGAGVIVAAEARIGDHVFLNRAASIGHHTVIESFSTIQAGVTLGGYGRVMEEVEIGIGATVIDRITIGRRTFVGAGAVVVGECPADSVMIGVPARPRTKSTTEPRAPAIVVGA